MSLRGNDVDHLVEELVRVASKQEDLAGELDGARAMLVDLKARRSSDRGFIVEERYHNDDQQAGKCLGQAQRTTTP